MQSYLSPTKETFLNTSNEYSDSNIILLGIPLDLTATFRKGTSHGPETIRKASLDLESYDLFFEYDIEDASFCDIGDIILDSNDLHQNFERIMAVAGEIYEKNKILISMGGEHTITYPLTKVVKPDLIIQFDAHADLREEYLGEKWTHASVMKRILDENPNISILNFGLRALSKKERDTMRKEHRFRYLDSYQILEKSIGEINEYLLKYTKLYKRIYISIDLDVLDLASCPGVCNPEPGGLPYITLKRILKRFSQFNNKIKGIDIVELNPLFDRNSSPFIAAKIMFDIISVLSIS